MTDEKMVSICLIHAENFDNPPPSEYAFMETKYVNMYFMGGLLAFEPWNNTIDKLCENNPEFLDNEDYRLCKILPTRAEWLAAR